MNDEIPEANAKHSMCWDCKFGICVRESEVEKMFHPAMGEGPTNVFDEQQNTPDIIEHSIEHKRVKTICFWRPKNIEQAPPILIGKVEQCNRYERNN